MKFLGFTAAPDLMGRRIRLAWGWAMEGLETPGQIPDVIVRRKTRDFAFPPLAVPDPFLVHDSAVFPPAPIPGVLAVIDLPDRAVTVPGLTARVSTISLSAMQPSGSLEFQRRRDTVWRDGAGRIVRSEVELLDARDLAAGTSYYYELDDGSAPTPERVSLYRGIARAGEVHGLNRKLWSLLPETYKGADAQLPPAASAFAGVPEAGRSGGQLRRFIDVFGMGLDALRNGAEGLAALRDVEAATPPALAALGRQIGWDVAPALPIEQSRNELETATRLFAFGGTVQSLRALVAHQTGWRAQVAEMATGLIRAGRPAQGILRFSIERAAAPGGFSGGLDASTLFAFPPGGATGGVGLRASLVATIPGPYALRPGFELTVAVDGGAPARIVFGPDDFADIAAANASEIAAVFNRHFDDVRARSQAGALVLETELDSPEASLRVETARESLLAFSDAPAGRLAVFSDAVGPRLAYPTREERPAADGSAAVAFRPFLKSWGFGEWRDAKELPAWGDGAAEVAAAAPAGEPWIAFGAGARIKLARARPRAPAPAVLTGVRAGPFAFLAGQRLTLTTELGSETYFVNAADFGTLAAATTAELAAAMNAQLVNVTATALPDGSLRLATIATGSATWLAVDLANSTMARIVGLAAKALRATGGWDETVDWSDAEAGPRAAGPVASPAACVHDGGVVLAWAEHEDAAWRIRTAKWRPVIALASSNGLAEGQPGGAWTIATTADGLPSNVIRGVAADASGVLSVATDSGLGQRRGGGPWTSITTVDGLPSNDLRALAALPAGALALATAAGLAEVSPLGAVAVTTQSPAGLLDDDLRSLAAGPEGDLLIGSATGLSKRDHFGRWSRWTVADGLPPGPIQAVVSFGDTLAAGSAAGLSVREGGTWRQVSLAEGLPSTDIRAVKATPDGGFIVATAAGLARRDPVSLAWSGITPAEGLPIADIRAVAAGSEDRILVGGPAGMAISAPRGAAPWSLLTVADGLPAGGIDGIDGPWSAPLVVAAPLEGAAEPHLAAAADGRLWLAYSARDALPASEIDNWTLRLRRFDPATALWGAEQALTIALPGGSADREPFVLADPLAGARIFFSSDRGGGRGLASLSVDSGGVAGAPSLFPLDSAEARHPAALRRPNGDIWLFHQGDRPYSASQVATLGPVGAPQPSLRLADAATLVSPAGLRTPVLRHLSRHALRHQPGDPMPYTPERLDVGGGAPGDPAPLHTRRTLVLHLSPAPFGLPPTQDRLQRLIQLLNRFKPINTRLRLLVRTPPMVEIVYPPEADIGDAWGDNVPIVEALGAVGERLHVAYPGLSVLRAFEPASRSADFVDRATLQRRTCFPDLI
jgi:hypothetical protein